MQIVLFDPKFRDSLLPLTFTKSVAKLRVGGFCIDQKWEKALGLLVKILTQDYLQSVFPSNVEQSEYAVNGALIPTEELVVLIEKLETGQSLYSGDNWLATRTHDFSNKELMHSPKIECNLEVKIVDRSWKIFQYNDWALREDFKWIADNLNRVLVLVLLN